MQTVPGKIKLVTDQGAVNLRWSAAFLGACAAQGVRHLVLSPGARSTPLVLAAEKTDGLRLHTLPDERAAAFFALGLAKNSQAPVAILSTSGSAAANWFPAVVESSQGNTPLLLLSADRPQEMHHSGANQTIDQSNLFGGFVRQRMLLNVDFCDDSELKHARHIAARAVDFAQWPRPGPVHVNIGFKEPLVPVEWPDIESDLSETRNADCLRYGRTQADPGQLEDVVRSLSSGRGVIICGPETPDDAIEPVTRLAGIADCPIVADVLSGLRFGNHDRGRVLTGYDTVLRDPDSFDAWCCDWIIQTGFLPVSSHVQDFAAAQPFRIWISPNGDWPDPQHSGGIVLRADCCAVLNLLIERMEPVTHDGWFEKFRAADICTSAVLAELPERPFEADIVRSVQDLIPDNAALFVGNSMVVRDADAFMSGRQHPLRVFGNRGASGIDGNVSTALGIAADENRRVVALLGDLAVYHDMNGLLMAKNVNATLVVFANGGGEIFRFLPQDKLPGLEEHWVCDTGLDLSKIADLYDLYCQHVVDSAGFETALKASLKRDGVTLIAAVIDPDDSVSRHKAFWSAVAQHTKSQGGMLDSGGVEP